ncbi:hypothetical protein HALDL1_08945 [Halobacterium sp. DL1]|jgi:hypothetical protein|nr:hypothetical protein HALDL1_08945 [Halobacterium sp. DL1]
MECSSIERSTSNDLLHRIIREVADRSAVEPTSLPPLYDVLDPDALTALVQTRADSLTVQFTYVGYEVTVDSDGKVSVTDEERRSRPTVGPGEQ